MAGWLRCSSVTGPCGHAPSSGQNKLMAARFAGCLAIQPFPEQRHAQLFKTLCIRPRRERREWQRMMTDSHFRI